MAEAGHASGAVQPPAAVAVLGGGRMGSGIAHVFAAWGAQVTVVERDPEASAHAVERVRESLSKADQRDGLGRPLEQAVACVSTVHDVIRVPEATELLIEALPELPDLKREMLTRAEQSVAGDCILATNTSSLSIEQLARGMTYPERFLGLHFFNPVPVSTLVEIVAGPATDPTVMQTAADWVAALDKETIVVRDSPGFATSRLGVLLGLEAIRMLEEGVATAEDVDLAMELGYRHPMGPLRLTDLVGLDVRLHISEYLSATLGPRFAPPQLLQDKVANGDLGRKTGRGFYDWDSPPTRSRADR